MEANVMVDHVADADEYEVQSMRDVIASRASRPLSTAQATRQRLQAMEVDQAAQQQVQTRIRSITDDPQYVAMLRALSVQFPVYHTDLRGILHAGETTSDILQAVLRTPRPVQSVRLAAHESSMLKEQGAWPTPEAGGRRVVFPACSRDNHCCAYLYWKSIEGLTRPTVLMASMSEQDYEHLLQYGCTPNPNYRAPCVLCCRYTIGALVFKHRRLLMDGDATPMQQPAARDPIVDYAAMVQPYFNLRDEEGGYKSSCFMPVRRNDPILQPTPMLSLEMLSASEQEDTHRWIIDQSRMIYRHLGVTPAIGTSLKDFLERSRRSVSAERLYELALEREAEHLRQRVWTLLLRQQLKTSDRSILVQGDKIDRLLCEQMMSRPGPLSLICAQLTDVIRLLPPEESYSTRYIPWSSLTVSMWSKLCTDVLLDPSIPHHIQNAAFFSPLAEVSMPILHLITKCCVNARCQCRTFPRIVRKLLVTIKRTRRKKKGKKGRVVVDTVETFVLRLCKEMVLCGLLGNFSHSEASTRPPPAVRQKLYDLFTQDKYNRWCVRLFEHSTSVLIYSVRSTMVWILDHHPALLQQVYGEEMMQYPEFRRITEEGMNLLRQIFTQSLANPFSAMSACLLTLPEQPCAKVHLWSCGHKRCVVPGVCLGRTKGKGAVVSPVTPAAASPDIEADRASGWAWDAHAMHMEIEKHPALMALEQAMKNISYRRPHICMAKLLRPQRKDFPLVPYRRTLEAPVAVDELSEAFSGLLVGGEEEEEEEEHEGEQDDDRYLFPRGKSSPYVPDDHLEAARQIISHCGPVGYGNPIPRVLDFLPCFGVSETNTAYLQNLFMQYRHHQAATQHIQRALWKLRAVDPHSYNLIHIFSELLEQASRRLKLIDLPLHVTTAQLEGLREAHGITEPRRLLDSSVSFVFCPVCLHIYSQIRDSNTVYKSAFNVGLRDASFSYLAQKSYCRNRRVNHRGRCGEEELVRIPMIGRFLWFGQKLILLCPQRGCGMLMCIDQKDETFMVQNARGPACWKCTKTLTDKKVQLQSLEQSYRKSRIQCQYCPPGHAPIYPALEARIYGDNTYLCPEHHTPELVKAVQKALKALPVGQERTDTIDAVLREHHPNTIARRAAEEVKKARLAAGRYVWDIHEGRMQYIKNE